MSIQSASARDFWPLESRHFVSLLRYLIQFISLCSFLDCGFRVRVSSTVRVSVIFIFCCIFPFPCRLKERKLPPGWLPLWLRGSVFRLYCIGCGFDSHAMIIFYFLKSFCKVFCKLGLGKWRWRLSSGRKSRAGAFYINTVFIFAITLSNQAIFW